MFEKIDVNGEKEHPLFTYLKVRAIIIESRLSRDTTMEIRVKSKTNITVNISQSWFGTY